MTEPIIYMLLPFNLTVVVRDFRNKFLDVLGIVVVDESLEE